MLKRVSAPNKYKEQRYFLAIYLKFCEYEQFFLVMLWHFDKKDLFTTVVF